MASSAVFPDYLFLVTMIKSIIMENSWHLGVVVITTAQLHSTKPELSAGSNPARGVLEI